MKRLGRQHYPPNRRRADNVKFGHLGEEAVSSEASAEAPKPKPKSKAKPKAKLKVVAKNGAADA
jgi:hypothetical protein